MPRVKLFDEGEVLNKAMSLFWKQGYAATSIQDLVTHLGVNRASLYATFGDKEQLFKKSFQHYRQQNLEALARFLHHIPKVKEGFAALFSKTIDQAVSDQERKGCFVVNTTTELIPNDTTFVNLLEQNKEEVEKIFYNYLKQGRDSGQLKTDQDLQSLATVLFTLYNGLQVVAKINPDSKQLVASMETALTLVY